MGVVYEAEQISLARRVALKTTCHRSRKMNRKHSVFNARRVYDVGETGDSRYYAMQLIDGRTLDRVARA